MDPKIIERSLIEHYKMTPDLAARVARNLLASGDYTGYEAAKPTASQIPGPLSPSARKGGQTIRPTREHEGDAVAQRRIDYYHNLIERQRNGEDIGAENHEWLAKVHAQAGASNIGKRKKKQQEDVRMTIPQATLFNSLYNNIPMGDMEATRRYLGKLGGGQFFNGIDRGYANAELHPVPSVGAAAPLPQSAQPALLPNGQYRTDTSINPWGVMPDVIKI